ncbi:hypothetical protein [Mycolicibacterium austroafricanum]|uniref:hypothetical protein n=1 Tax=Mycolicibacterium austroafricanum TaxID=39687 RepID=UPI000CF9CA67|nr:hypothetical protein [Mycolicibacterium austroafricanum]PQP42398.1 hypothetical protein C6A88_26375 [Mycolicibacterium austroafricanum]
MSTPEAPLRADRLEESADLSELTPEQLAALLEQAEAEVAAAEEAAEAARARVHPARRSRTGSRRRSRWQTGAYVVAVLCSVAMVAASGLILFGHRNAVQDQQNRAEFAAAAKQVAVTLMSIDFNDPQAGMHRIIDNSVDPFRAEFQSSSDEFVKLSADAKVTTKATASVAAVQSATADSAVVLVAATSTVTNADGVAEPPRSWQLKLELQRDGDRIKMSKVDFLQ